MGLGEREREREREKGVNFDSVSQYFSLKNSFTGK